MNKNNRGFAILEAILIVVVLAVVGGGGYFAWHKTHAKSSAQNSQTSQPTGDQLVSVDASKLPPTWKIDDADTHNVTVRNNGPGADPNRPCWVNVYGADDAHAKPGNANFAKDLKRQAINNAQNEKGFKYSGLPEATLRVKTDQGTKSISAAYGKFVGPSGSSIPMYQKNAFIVLSGRYVGITESCAVPDFAQADQALAAILVRMGN